MKRIYHTWEKWECYPAGFYEDKPPEGITKIRAEEIYVEVLGDVKLFESILKKIIVEWKYSCEHYLTNDRMNRIAWLGQAAVAYHTRVPSCFRSGYFKLTDIQQQKADKVALKYLNKWLKMRGEKSLTMEGAQSKTEPNLY